MAELVSVPEHGETLIQDGRASPSLQLFFDELQLLLNGQLLGPALQLSIHTVAGVPDATSFTGAMIFVSDETGGSVPAFSDGVNWRRVTDRAVIS